MEQDWTFWWTYVILDFIVSAVEYSREFLCVYVKGWCWVNKVPFLSIFWIFSLYFTVYPAVRPYYCLRVALFSLLFVILPVLLFLCLVYLFWLYAGLCLRFLFFCLRLFVLFG